MAKISVYNLEGKETEKLDLSDEVFSLGRNDDLVHQVFVSLEANKRQVLAHTKNRGERAGSGIKPWRQKGTGRARVGSVRSPIWRKGGIIFGPRNDRNFTKKINKKMNSKAIAIVLSGKLKDNEIKIIDKLELKENKTKNMANILSNLSLKGKVLFAFSDNEKDLRRFSRNLKEISNILSNQLNVSDMLKNKYLLMSKESIKFIENKYNNSSKIEK